MKKKLIYTIVLMLGILFPALSGNQHQVSSFVQTDQDTVRTLSPRSLSPSGNRPEVIPPSPQMEAFQTFTDIPVSYSTGVPDVSIPLYTLKSGNIEIPVVLRYHTHNVKPHMALSTNVALGWTVDYGGSLSRSIVGSPDETLSAVDPSKSYSESSMSDYGTLYGAAHNTGTDLQSDHFHYSMPTGESGRFFLERKSWSGTFADRYSCWLYPNTETRVDASLDSSNAFATFTLTDRYGLQCQYGNGYVEYPQAYYSTGGYCAWMLKKVTDPKTGRSVDYTYAAYSDTAAEDRENTFSASSATLYDEDPRSSLNVGIQLTNGQLHDEQSLCVHMYDPETTYLDNNCLGAKRRDYSLGEVKGYRSWKPVTISDGHVTVTFNYVSSTDNRISSIVVKAGSTVVKTVTFTTTTGSDNVPVLASVKMTGKAGSSDQIYSFGYNSAWSSTAPDFWGFATNRTASPYSGCYTQQQTLTYRRMNGAFPNYDLHVNGNPGQTATTTLGTHDFSGSTLSTSYLLSRITYPTGGYHSLSYESGKYLDGTVAKTGGSPRVKSITEHPVTGSSRTRTFTYQTGKTDLIPGTLALYLNAHQQVSGESSGRTISTTRSYGNSPHFGLDIDVHYPQVDVTYTDGTSSFKEVYTYNTAQEHTYGILFMLNQYQRYYVKNFFSNPLKGKLLKKQVYDSSSTLKQEESYTYTTSVRRSINNQLTLCQIEGLTWENYQAVQNGGENIGFLKYPVFQYAYYTIQVPTSTLTKKTITAYDGSTSVVTTEDYTYATGSDVKLTKKATSRSGGSILTEDYTYVSASSTNGTSLLNANMTGLQETVTSTQGGQSESLKYGYTSSGLNDKTWYRQGSGSWQLRSTVEYGSYGNPVKAYGPDNNPIRYVWAYRGRYPVGRIDGLSDSDFAKVKILHVNNTAPADSLEILRLALKGYGGHLTGRLYDDTTGNVVKEILPSGETVSYTYDGWSRLTAVKDDNAKTVREHHYSLGSNNNYIITKTTVYHGDIVSSIMKQWFDGLGRPLETVDMGASTSGKNLVTLTEYDQAGRTVKQWLPYASTADYVAPSTLKSGISSANYGGDTRPYSETQYEASTLGRILKEYGPGSAWASHPKTMEYLSNTASGLLACKVYGVSTANALTGGSSYYAAGQLFVTKAADEDGKSVYTFTDKQGQKLLERAVNGSEYLDTYYVYDNYGNLCFVLQPEYQTTADLSKYAFQYRYDTLKRCTWKKLPGASGMTMEYDSADRMIFSQDGNGKWTWYEYDNLGRLTKQGENTSKAVGSSPYLQNYYDTYSFVGSTGFTDSLFTNDQTGNSYGNLTGTVQTVLGTTTKLYTAYYYDNLGQVIKEVKSNLLGGYDTTVNTYTFTGKPATVTHTHTATGKTTRTEVYTYTYDGKDRLTKVTHKLGTDTAETLAEYTYDALGRQGTKKQGTNTSTYSYNIRNWLTGISSGKFTQTLGYGSHYNGNISSMNSTTYVGNDGVSHAYTFTYDGVNRMLNATHGTGVYTEKVTSYDKNGNIKALQRYGNGLIDNLTYTYNGNQLTKVEDATGNAAGFSNGASVANEYTYDNNGNLTKDSNKNISTIAYNCLNLPSKVTFSDGSTIVYSYAADGTKLRTVHTISSTTTQKDYCANVIYENGVQKMLLIEDGYVNLSDGKYFYYLKDHQGNNRVVIKEDGTVQETNHYYPFGSVFASTGNVQPYKYNGKELDTKKGLNWYDYGARHYDATLGRWFVVDPLAEKMGAWSPYVYCFNNPVRFIDPNGADGWDIVVGYGIGFITNILPNTGFIRDSYTPTDVSDYNNALRGMDNASMAIGLGMVAGGGIMESTGGSMVMSGVYMTAGTAGTGLAVGGTTAVGGTIVVGVGAAGVFSGGMLMTNALQNKDAGYDRGKKSNVSSGNKNSQHANQKAKNAAGQKYQETKDKYDYLHNKANKTKDDKKELDRLERQMKHWKRKQDFSGENHSRNAKGN